MPFNKGNNPFGSNLGTMSQILIIEDDPLILDSITEALDLEELDYRTATDGLSGLNVALQNLPSVVVCDVMLPELNGYDVLAGLRSNPSTAQIPFIFLTGRDARDDLRRGMDLGADDYLTKPFTLRELKTSIRTQLAKQKRNQSSVDEVQQQADRLQLEVKESQEIAQLKAMLLDKLVQELRAPLSNINMALGMLERAQTEADRSRYLGVLREEYSRELDILRDVQSLQDLTRSGSTGLNAIRNRLSAGL
jgi:two-component system, OmpR family, alkaline phosphatase synthesis response regulator PhoP